MESVKIKERLLITNTKAFNWHIPVLIGLGFISCVLLACAIWEYNHIQELASNVNYLSKKLSEKSAREKELELELETLEEKLDSTKEELETLAREYPIRIREIMLSNVRNDNTVVSEYRTTTWISGSVYYIRPTLKLFAYKSGKLDIGYKIYHDGKLNYNPSISRVFSGRLKTVELSKGENTVELIGWGSDRGTSYQAGEYQIEVWTQGKCYGRYSFEIK